MAAGEIGPLRVVHVAYVQGSLGTAVEADPEAMPKRLRWRLDPAIGVAYLRLAIILATYDMASARERYRKAVLLRGTLAERPVSLVVSMTTPHERQLARVPLDLVSSAAFARRFWARLLDAPPRRLLRSLREQLRRDLAV